MIVSVCVSDCLCLCVSICLCICARLCLCVSCARNCLFALVIVYSLFFVAWCGLRVYVRLCLYARRFMCVCLCFVFVL